MELSDIKDILRMLEEQEISEFELEQDGVKLRICRSKVAEPAVGAPPSVVQYTAPVAPVGPPAAARTTAAATVPPAPSPAAEPAPATAAEEAASEGATVVESPIVGTFYRAPDPSSPPFVNVGDQVRVGQVLCIIEAMKLMNEIEAEVGGEVLKVHSENGQPVQYGDPLFTVRPA